MWTYLYFFMCFTALHFNRAEFDPSVLSIKLNLRHTCQTSYFAFHRGYKSLKDSFTCPIPCFMVRVDEIRMCVQEKMCFLALCIALVLSLAFFTWIVPVYQEWIVFVLDFAHRSKAVTLRMGEKWLPLFPLSSSLCINLLKERLGPLW